MFPASLIESNVNKKITQDYKNNNIHTKLIQCIDEYYDDQFLLEELLQKFVGSSNSVFNNLLNTLQTCITFIVFYVEKNKVPDNISELELFLREKNINRTCSPDDFNIILEKFRSETCEIDINSDFILDKINFREIKDKINFNGCNQSDFYGYSPVVEGFIINNCDNLK